MCLIIYAWMLINVFVKEATIYNNSGIDFF